jgi:hypothetical protein
MSIFKNKNAQKTNKTSAVNSKIQTKSALERTFSADVSAKPSKKSPQKKKAKSAKQNDQAPR